MVIDADAVLFLVIDGSVDRFPLPYVLRYKGR
jgi:hypothetical protein